MTEFGNSVLVIGRYFETSGLECEFKPDYR